MVVPARRDHVLQPIALLIMTCSGRAKLHIGGPLSSGEGDVLASAETANKLAAGCDDAYCTSPGGKGPPDCCAPEDLEEESTCSQGMKPMRTHKTCFGFADSTYTCCPPGVLPDEAQGDQNRADNFPDCAHCTSFPMDENNLRWDGQLQDSGYVHQAIGYCVERLDQGGESSGFLRRFSQFCRPLSKRCKQDQYGHEDCEHTCDQYGAPMRVRT